MTPTTRRVFRRPSRIFLIAGSPAAEQVMAQLAGPFHSHPTGLGDASAQGVGALANLVRREAFVLAHIDAFWLIARVSVASYRPGFLNPIGQPRATAVAIPARGFLP